MRAGLGRSCARLELAGPRLRNGDFVPNGFAEPKGRFSVPIRDDRLNSRQISGLDVVNPTKRATKI